MADSNLRHWLVFFLPGKVPGSWVPLRIRRKSDAFMAA